jgi:hypothetical protein
MTDRPPCRMLSLCGISGPPVMAAADRLAWSRSAFDLDVTSLLPDAPASANLAIAQLAFAPGHVAPEPATLLCVATGAAALLVRRYRRK